MILPTATNPILPDILEIARLNYKRALAADDHRLPNPGWRWQAYSINARHLINRLKTPIEAIHQIQAPGADTGYEARMFGQTLVDHARVMEKNCQSLFPEFAHSLTSFAESPFSNPGTVAIVNDRLISSPLYNHILHIMRCVRYKRPARLVEIGGGYGAPGRLWLTNGLHRPRQYINIDLPESLFFAELYLRIHFPDQELLYIHDLDRSTIDMNRAPIVLCPITQIDSISQYPIDLCVNTGSLQEMTEEYVAFYQSWLDDANIETFYSANYFGQSIDQLLEGMNYAAPVMGSRWRTEYRALFGDLPRPVAEIIFSRDPERVADDYHQFDLNSAQIATCELFFEEFDRIRCVDDPKIIMSVVAKTISEMPYIPKECLFLARRARRLLEVQDLPVSSLELREANAVIALLELLASKGISQRGTVGAVVNAIRDRLIHGETAANVLASVGRVRDFTEGTVIEIDFRNRLFREGMCGAVEQIQAIEQCSTISGWALIRATGEAASKVHVFLDGYLAASVAPTITRPEFEGPLPVGFSCQLELDEPAASRKLLILAEFADGTLGRLEHGGVINPLPPPVSG